MHTRRLQRVIALMNPWVDRHPVLFVGSFAVACFYLWLTCAMIVEVFRQEHERSLLPRTFLAIAVGLVWPLVMCS